MSSDLRLVSEVLNFPSAPGTSYAIEPKPSSSRPMPPPDDLNPTGKERPKLPVPQEIPQNKQRRRLVLHL